MAQFKAALRMMRNEVASSTRVLGIKVVSGCVWLTHAGCREDWILESGDAAMVSPGMQSVVKALTESEVWIQDQEEPRRWLRLH